MPVMYATGGEERALVLPPESYRVVLPQPSEAQLQQAAELLANAERPFIVAGAGVDRAGANAALVALVELLQCPVTTTMAGRASVPRDHPNHIFGFGAGSDAVKRAADVVLVVGSRLGNLDLPYDKYWGDPARQKLIQIDIDPRHFGVSRPFTIGIVSDAKAALTGLLHELSTRRLSSGSREAMARHRADDQSWWEKQFEIVEQWKGPGVHPAHVMRAIGRVFGGDTIYTVDGGNTSLWAHWFLPSTRPRSYHSILELGMLGTGIPSAIGAKLGEPARDVVCVTGDGAAGFHFMEMQSAARERLKITTIVLAEGAWTMEEPNERVLYGRTFGTDMGTVRWDRVGEGLGCDGAYVERLDQLEPALHRAKDARGPGVVCVRTDKAANLATPQEFLMRFIEVYQGPMG